MGPLALRRGRSLPSRAMRPLLLLALLCSGCFYHHLPSRQVLTRDAIEELDDSAPEALRCSEDEVETRPLTLLTRVATGCGREQVYAWDAFRERWVLASAGRL